MRIVYKPIDQWPGRLREPSERITSPFSADWHSTVDLLDKEVFMIAAHEHDAIVIQLALPPTAFRNDGGFSARARTPDHPGAIITFESTHGPLRYSSDLYKGWGRRDGWRENVRAIALALEALRKVTRYGIGQGDEHYRGFGALPPGAARTAGPAMTTTEAARLLVDEAGMADEVAEVLAIGDPVLREAVFRAAAKAAHPDTGGTDERFRKVREARDLLEVSLG